MHDDRPLVEARIARELAERIVPAIHRGRAPMQVEAWVVPGEPVPYAEAAVARYEPFAVGSPWGRPWGTTWFRLTGDAPPRPAGRGMHLEALVDLGFDADVPGFQAEGLVWREGQPLQGVHPRRTAIALDGSAGRVELFVEAAANPRLPPFRPSSMGSLHTAGSDPIYVLRGIDLAWRDEEVFGLALDVEVLVELMQSLPVADPRRQRVLRTLERAFDALDLTDVASTAVAARSVLRPALEQPARASAHRIVAVGHAHIDTAWLWPLRETERKCARTFASAVRLMDDDPDYRFACSQAAQYDWVERTHPELFERIRAKVATGQWEPVGGMWVEPDMNLPGGESIVRQLVYGQRYFQERFGVRCDEIWIPDVFGYPGSLPQVFAAAGCTRFVTQKLSWNKQNPFPHSTFWWEGIDGTRVLTHFPPVDTYNAKVTGAQLARASDHFKEHGWSDWSLMPFGYGNGGGGPTREMVGRARRFADLDGAPRVRLGTVDEFFRHVEAEAAGNDRVPVWRGELYFETHRGTLTSQTRTKVGNLRCERLLREAELWWAAGGAVPDDVTAELDDLWRAVLLQQFHDILPGSSIAWVHADAEASHARCAERLEALVAQALHRVGPGVASVANATTRPRREIVAAPAGVTVSGPGLTQTLADGSVALCVSVPGSALVELRAEPVADRVVVTERSITNRSVSLTWDLHGDVVSVIDVGRGRELLRPGTRIGFELAPDHPIEYDAWDLEEWTSRGGAPLPPAESIELVERGPLVAAVCMRRRFGASTLAATWTVRAGSPRVDVAIDVDWHEDEHLLSMVVPLDVRADHASCGVQFGHVERPTHPSTRVDAAKFEVCAHRYVDLSEPSFGVAVLNDGRFGHGLFGGAVRVSLLRATRYPDPNADRGFHTVTVGLLAHGGGRHDVLAHAEALAWPLRFVEPGAAEALGGPVVTLDHPGVELSAVKRPMTPAPDDMELIVRLYEACGDRSQVTVRLPVPITVAWRCNLLEEPTSSVDTTDGIVTLVLRPFEIVTLRLGTRSRS